MSKLAKQMDEELKVLIKALKIAKSNHGEDAELVKCLKQEIANYEAFFDDLNNE